MTNTCRRIAPVPARHDGAAAIWDGHELLVVGAGPAARSAYAYDPALNRWRTLASLPSASRAGIAVWAGNRLLLVGGQRAGKSLHSELAYAPKTNHWTRLPVMPLRTDRNSGVAVWTGHELIVTDRGLAAAYTP